MKLSHESTTEAVGLRRSINMWCTDVKNLIGGSSYCKTKEETPTDMPPPNLLKKT